MRTTDRIPLKQTLLALIFQVDLMTWMMLSRPAEGRPQQGRESCIYPTSVQTIGNLNWIDPNDRKRDISAGNIDPIMQIISPDELMTRPRNDQPAAAFLGRYLSLERAPIESKSTFLLFVFCNSVPILRCKLKRNESNEGATRRQTLDNVLKQID